MKSSSLDAGNVGEYSAARFMGPAWDRHLGPIGPRWVPCWPNEPCYLGIFMTLGPMSVPSSRRWDNIGPTPFSVRVSQYSHRFSSQYASQSLHTRARYGVHFISSNFDLFAAPIMAMLHICHIGSCYNSAQLYNTKSDHIILLAVLWDDDAKGTSHPIGYYIALSFLHNSRSKLNWIISFYSSRLIRGHWGNFSIISVPME